MPDPTAVYQSACGNPLERRVDTANAHSVDDYAEIHFGCAVRRVVIQAAPKPWPYRLVSGRARSNNQ